MIRRSQSFIVREPVQRPKPNPSSERPVNLELCHRRIRSSVTFGNHGSQVSLDLRSTPGRDPLTFKDAPRIVT
jgi:hypothetical protein